jgi:hypothetical protein
MCRPATLVQLDRALHQFFRDLFAAVQDYAAKTPATPDTNRIRPAPPRLVSPYAPLGGRRCRAGCPCPDRDRAASRSGHTDPEYASRGLARDRCRTFPDKHSSPNTDATAPGTSEYLRQSAQLPALAQHGGASNHRHRRTDGHRLCRCRPCNRCHLSGPDLG